jgi:PKD domain/F5/8 type C domain
MVYQTLATFVISCSLLLGASEMTAVARSRTTALLKFKIKVVDSATGKPKSKYFLGETVSVVFTVTNQSRRARTIADLQETYIPYKLVSRFENKDTETFEDGRGGTGGAYVRGDGTVYWTVREPRKITLAPGQSVSVRIDDLRGRYSHRLGDGYHTLTATYIEGLKSKVSFRIVIDEVKTITLLEKMAAAPAVNGDESDRVWASNYLEEIRQPSMSGFVTDTAGKGLKDVRISITGQEDRRYDTRSNGGYYVEQLMKGGTYTITPSLRLAGNFDAKFTFEPPSRTITNLNSKLTNLNFTATRVRASLNVAEDREGATATASSTLTGPADEFEVGNVIDGVNAGQWDRCCNAAWVDATPNTYPDWVEVKFNEPTAINWINVFTLQDHPEPSHDPTLNETFTRDGITDFDVQYWNGRGWKTVPGGAIRGNRNVWRKIAFPPITTNKIRVVIRKSLAGYSKIMEIEAYHINEFPVVRLMGRSKGRTGSTFEFRADSSDQDGSIYRYTVDFGDGGPKYEKEFGSKPAVKEFNLTHTHTYAAAGTYTVTLSVLDHDFEGSETTMTVTVTDPPKLSEARHP